jgi:hypothetical protein
MKAHQELKLKRKQQGLQFMVTKELRLEDVPITTILMAIVIRLSYIISLLIVFWVGFYSVSVIQFLLVIMLLIFLVNESMQCQYRIASKKKNLPIGEDGIILVPFAFKYWILFVGYTNLIIGAK